MAECEVAMTVRKRWSRDSMRAVVLFMGAVGEFAEKELLRIVS